MRKILGFPLDPQPALQVAGNPPRTMWPNMPLRIGEEEIVVAGLVRLEWPDDFPQFLVIEFEPTEASLHRERLITSLGIQVVRLSRDDVLREDFTEHLDSRLMQAAAVGTGRLTRVLGVDLGPPPPRSPAPARPAPRRPGQAVPFRRPTWSRRGRRSA